MSNDTKQSKRERFLALRTGRGDPGRSVPSPEAKKQGWERKRMAKKLMDRLALHCDMTGEELDEYIKQQTKLGKLTVGESLMITYLQHAKLDGKFLIDFMNRHIPYAPQRVDTGSSEVIREIETTDVY